MTRGRAALLLLHTSWLWGRWHPLGLSSKGTTGRDVSHRLHAVLAWPSPCATDGCALAARPDPRLLSAQRPWRPFYSRKTRCNFHLFLHTLQCQQCVKVLSPQETLNTRPATRFLPSQTEVDDVYFKWTEFPSGVKFIQLQVKRNNWLVYYLLYLLFLYKSLIILFTCYLNQPSLKHAQKMNNSPFFKKIN